MYTTGESCDVADKEHCAIGNIQFSMTLYQPRLQQVKEQKMFFTPNKIHSWLEIRYFNISSWKVYLKKNLNAGFVSYVNPLKYCPKSH